MVLNVHVRRYGANIWIAFGRNLRNLPLRAHVVYASMVHHNVESRSYA